MFGGNFAPVGWFLCQGQLLPISQYQALFAILGTTYGGDGVSTFALPDLRCRAPLNQGQGLGLSAYTPGEKTGVENVTLLMNQLPAHTHLVNASTNPADQGSPAGGIYAVESDSAQGAVAAYTKTAANTTMAPNAMSIAGGSQPFEILQPLLSVTFIIAFTGIFPSRN
jgi:microcystin-dependent protein